MPEQTEEPSNFFQSLWNHQYVQIIIGYFVGVWGFIQFTDWILTRYEISPRWVDVLLLFFLCMTPSLLYHVWSKDRVPKGKNRFPKKIMIPINLTLTLILLFILFRNTDLGATSETVHFNNESGVMQSRKIIKPDFRMKLAVHNFIPEQEDSTHQWMNWGIHAGVTEDISQNGYLTLGFWHKTASLQEMLKQAKDDFFPYILTGSYKVDGDVYEITSKLYKTQNGALKSTHTYKAKNFFALLDSISTATLKDLDFKPSQISQFVDLPFDQAFTSNMEAYKNYALFFEKSSLQYLEKAIRLDSTFALANHTMASFLHSNSFSVLGAKEAIEQGMRFRKRLPEDFQSNLKLTYFQINKQVDHAIALLKMQLEMNPDDLNHLKSLTNYLFLSEQYEDLLIWRKKIAAIDKEPGAQLELAEAFLLTNNFADAGKTILKVLDQYPNHPDAIANLAMYYALSNQIEKSEPLIQRLVLQNPEIAPLTSVYLKAFEYAKEQDLRPEDLSKYTGHYRIQDRSSEYDISVIGKLLFGKGRSHMGGFFFIPSGPDEFIMGNQNLFERWTFDSDTSGRVYQIRAQRVERDQAAQNSILWRQDSLIDHAFAIFDLDQKTKALAAFRLAYAKNPKHFYLAEYIKHLEFILDPANKDALENMKNYMGRYGPRHLWMEGGKIYYTREGMISKQRLLPITPDRFYFGGGYQYQMQVDVENGQVKGTVSWEYDNATGAFVRDDSDYIPFNTFKD